MKKNTKIWSCILPIMAFVILLIGSCKKENEDNNNNQPEKGIVTDIDRNEYKTIKIGNQWWMAENLRTTKLRDATAIPLVINDMEWYNMLTPGYCWYDNDSSTFKDDYGALYNSFAIETEKLCPTDWHIPTKSEWEELFTFLGGNIDLQYNVAGVKLMEKGTAHWIAPNSEATNESGFTALPGGARMVGSAFIGERGYWWIRSENNSIYRVLLSPGGYIDIWYGAENTGFSVRCIKD